MDTIRSVCIAFVLCGLALMYVANWLMDRAAEVLR